MARPVEIELEKRLSIGLTSEQVAAIDSIVSTRQNGKKIKSEADAVRHALDFALVAGNALKVKKPILAPRAFPLLKNICCGSPCALMETVTSGELPEYEITDSAALQWATEHSFIGEADGWSMHDQQHPQSISHGDHLLMVPIDEWTFEIVAGRVVLAFVRLKNGDEGCTLKEYAGKKLKARNKGFRDVDFDFGGDVVDCTPLAVCVWRLGRCMV